MRIEIVPCLSDNYAYLLFGDTDGAVVIDPSEAEPVRRCLEQNERALTGIWLTHHHHDHVGGVRGLLDAYGELPVLGSEYDFERGRIPGQTRALHENDVLWFEGQRVRVLRVPGHTLGALAYVVGDALFSGDTLFASGCGRLFEGTPELMQRSLESLRVLPPETKLYAGHEYTVKNLSFAATIEPDSREVATHLARAGELRAKGLCTLPSTIGDELAVNPFLRWDAPEVIARARELGATSHGAADVFAAVRRARDVF